jgi:hypothetical protein
MAEKDVDRFLSEAEECVRLSELAINPLDKRAWLELAEDWIRLAKAVKERDA